MSVANQAVAAGATDLASASTIAELSAKHCVFRCMDDHYAIAATSIREVCHAPPLVRIPRTPNSFAGLCHIRSEFVPVVELNSLLGNPQSATEPNPGMSQLLVLASSLGPWALMIDQVIAIETIQTHVDADHRNEGRLAPVLGTASFDGQVVRVLNPNALHRMTATQLIGDEQPARTSR